MTMPNPTPDTREAMVEVTQADRDAAAAMWRSANAELAEHEWQCDWMRDGTADQGPVVQAFACHRIATRKAVWRFGWTCWIIGRRIRKATLLEAAAFVQEWGGNTGYTNSLATAIRLLAEGDA